MRTTRWLAALVIAYHPFKMKNVINGGWKGVGEIKDRYFLMGIEKRSGNTGGPIIKREW